MLVYVVRHKFRSGQSQSAANHHTSEEPIVLPERLRREGLRHGARLRLRIVSHSTVGTPIPGQAGAKERHAPAIWLLT